ncbi:MAG TPA: hypothetical protein VK126_03555, partial [Nitrososphaerales archaeon]|nr:hypothetical protein [Nitrososphaerales archaeon]
MNYAKIIWKGVGVVIDLIVLGEFLLNPAVVGAISGFGQTYAQLIYDAIVIALLVGLAVLSGLLAIQINSRLTRAEKTIEQTKSPEPELPEIGGTKYDSTLRLKKNIPDFEVMLPMATNRIRFLGASL